MPQFPNLTAVFRRYPERYHPRRIDASESHQGFSGATIHRVEADAGIFCLRCWPVQAPPVARIRGLHHLLAQIHDRGVSQVAVPVQTIDGQTLVDVEQRLWQLEPWMPGRADFHENSSDTRLRNAMRALAAWHIAAASFQPPMEARQWFTTTANASSPTSGERLERLRNWMRGDLDELRRIMARTPHDLFCMEGERAVRIFNICVRDIEGQLLASARMQFSIQPCLRDIHDAHVLFTGDEVSGLIDPSSCRSDNVAIDLARLVGSLFGTEPRGWDVALSEYGHHRPLTLEEAALAQVFNISGLLLSALRWLERRFLERETFANTEGVLRRLRGILDRLESPT